MVKFLLDSGADVNAKDKDDITALMEAAIMGHKDIVTHLIKVQLPPFLSPVLLSFLLLLTSFSYI